MTDLQQAVNRALLAVHRQRFVSAVMLAEAAAADLATRGEPVELGDLLLLAEKALHREAA